MRGNGSIVVGIVGGTGTGKSTLARAVAAAHGRACIVSQDDYYLPRPAHIPHEAYNYDHPDAIEWALLTRHLDELRAGRAVVSPTYVHATSSRIDGRRIEPAPLILVEGILLMAGDGVEERLDFAVYLDLDPDEQLRRRMRRDTAERGCTEADVLRMWRDTVLPMQIEHVEPGRARCHLRLREEPPPAMAEAVLSALAARGGDLP